MLINVEHPLKTKILLSAFFCGIAFIAFLFSSMPLLNLIALPFLVAGLYAITSYKSLEPWARQLIWAVSLFVGFFIAIYRPSDFSYPLVWATERLYPGGDPYFLYANISKALGGYLVIVWLLNSPSSHQQSARPILNSAFITAFCVFALLGIANVCFGVDWALKVSIGIIYFSAVNLFVTVLAEEAFFRLFIQDRIQVLFSNTKLGTGVSIVFVTALFAFSHTASIGPTFFLFLVAGFTYSVVYAVTRRFSMALAVHFGVNIFHFIFLEYPIPS